MVLPWCIASIEDVKNNFAYSGYPEEMVQFVKGDVGITLKDKENLPKEIALLRLDTDWYESTKIELEVLFPRLVRGGVCLRSLIWTSPGKQVFSVMMFQRVCSLIYGLFVQAYKPAGPDGIRE